jgi:hypothetical protein
MRDFVVRLRDKFPPVGFTLIVRTTCLFWMLFPLVALAGDWELGAAAGYGYLRNGSAAGTSGSVEAGFRSRQTFSVVATEEMFEHFGGELRYSYHNGAAFLGGDAALLERPANAHALHYDALFHLKATDSRFRPFFAVGGGVKIFSTSGTIPSTNPVKGYGSIRNANDVAAMLVIGPGVKYRLTDHLILRFDFQDQITTLPKGIFLPASSGGIKGLLHQFTPMLGLSAAF